MRDKVLVSIVLPATRKTYDMWIPWDETFRDTTPLIASLVESRASDRFIASPDVSLMPDETGNPVDPDLTPRKAKLVQGSRLILV